MPHRHLQREPQTQAPSAGVWTNREAYLLAAVCLTAGVLLGYLFGGSAQPMAITSPAGAVSQASSGGPLHLANAVQPLAAPLLAAAQADPSNADVWARLGNLYYDNHVYPQAIEYYTRSLELNPNDVNVRTDLGTSYWYSGFADKAIAEYEKSLALNPSHPETLLNLGVVKLQGMNDATGAVRAWETLLRTNPAFPDRARIETMLAQARQMAGPISK